MAGSRRLVLFLVVCLCVVALPFMLNYVYEPRYLPPHSVYNLTLLITAALLAFGLIFFSTALPFLSTIGLAVLLTPTAQVWFCSPARLTNAHLWKAVDARGEAREILMFSVESCLRDMPFGDLYRFSLLDPGLTLDVNGNDMRNVTHMSNATDELQLWLFVSREETKSVSVSILAALPSQPPFLTENSELSYEVTGYIKPQGSYRAIRKQLEKESGVYVRPFVFIVSSVIIN